MKARVTVTLKSGVLDPQGQAITGSLRSLGFAGLSSVRQGKVFDIDIAGNDHNAVRSALALMCDRLLANTVIENYAIEIEGSESAISAPAAPLMDAAAEPEVVPASIFQLDTEPAPPEPLPDAAPAMDLYGDDILAPPPPTDTAEPAAMVPPLRWPDELEADAAPEGEAVEAPDVEALPEAAEPPEAEAPDAPPADTPDQGETEKPQPEAISGTPTPSPLGS